METVRRLQVHEVGRQKNIRTTENPVLPESFAVLPLSVMGFGEERKRCLWIGGI